MNSVLLSNSNKNKILMYADDTILITAMSTYQEAKVITSELVNEVAIDFSHHGLLLNAEKTALLTFKQNAPEPILVKDTFISPSRECKYLGIIIDENLSWKPHIQQLLKKLGSSFFIIKGLSKIESNLAMLAYHSTFAAHLSYGIEVWGGGAASLINDILLLQKRVVRTVLKLPFQQSARCGFSQLGIITVYSLYTYKTLLYAKDLVDKGLLTSANTNHPYATRSGHKLTVSYRRTKTMENSPFSAAVKLYNMLDISITCLPKKKFKSTIKKFMTDHVSYSTEEVYNNLKLLRL